MKNNIIRFVYVIVAVCCVFACSVGCKKSVDIDNSSSEPTKIVEPVVSEPEDVSSVEETVSEPEVSAPVETASEVQQTQSSTTTSKKQTSSKTNTQKQQTQATQPVQQQQPSGPAWNGTIGNVDPTWTCPDPSAHGGYANDCFNKLKHEDMIQELKQEQEIISAAAQQGAAKWGMTPDEWLVWSKTHCDRCGKPFGDGHNGTCNSYFNDATGHMECHHYD